MGVSIRRNSPIPYISGVYCSRVESHRPLRLRSPPVWSSSGDSTCCRPIQGQIIAQVAARAACQTTDGPAGYIRFTLSPPAWTPTDTDLSDPDIVKAIDTQIAELQRVKNAILKLKQYGDFPVRTVLPSNPEARIDVLFRGATAEDVARWNKK